MDFLKARVADFITPKDAWNTDLLAKATPPEDSKITGKALIVKSHEDVSSWSPPPPGSVKINTDTSWSPLSPLAGLGIVIRESLGALKAISTINSQPVIDCPSEKALAINEGLILALSLKLKDIIVETDCF
ncbi:unnamed protein product [Citrullus colocynthis]|uniref:RNase H type-1 domain-containing protein n=1 Tax=Citrullus colocynthis TaxID=252529 RepID=A0ABP0YA13_9ROSI